MDFSQDANADALRQEAHDFFSRYVTEDVHEEVRRTGTDHDPALHAALAERGWLTSSWSKEEGGGGLTALEMAPFYEEAMLHDAPLVAALTTGLVAETLRIFGTEEQRHTTLADVIAGRRLVCLGLSEPDAGSDVAAARTRAVRDGGRWQINGQKMFTTCAQVCDDVYLLTRTSTEESKHRGLTLFLVPLSSSGIEIRPVRTLGGERTNITFYTDVEVDDDRRIGEIGGAWRVLMRTLNFERGIYPAPAGRCQRLLNAAVSWAGTLDLDARDDIADCLGDLAIRTEVGRLLGLQAVWRHSVGQVNPVGSAMAKLYASEALQSFTESLIDVGGPAALERGGDAIMGGELERASRHAPVETTYSGSSEIMRNIIAAEGLGLPRS